MKKLVFLSIGILALFACNREAVKDNSAKEIRFTTNVASYTVKATEAALEDNDVVSIIAGEPINATSQATVSGTSLVLDPVLYWNAGQTSSTTFVAFYADGDAPGSTSLAYDLSNGNYAYHSKLLAATKTASPSDESVVLAFKHPFSKVVINVTNELGEDAVSAISLKGVVLKADMDFAAGTVDLAEYEAGNVSATKISETPEKWAAIIQPQTAKPEIEVTTTLGSVYKFILSDNFVFKAGEVATAALTLSGSSYSGETHGDAVVYSFSVTDWAAAEDDVDVTATESTVSDEYWYIEGTINGTSWGTAYPMVYVSDKVWTVDFTYEGYNSSDEEVASAGFKLHKTAGWTSDQIGADPDNQIFAVDGSVNWGWKTGNDNIKLAANGDYTITYDYTDGDKVTITPKN